MGPQGLQINTYAHPEHWNEDPLYEFPVDYMKIWPGVSRTRSIWVNPLCNLGLQGDLLLHDQRTLGCTHRDSRAPHTVVRHTNIHANITLTSKVFNADVSRHGSPRWRGLSDRRVRLARESKQQIDKVHGWWCTERR